MSDDEAIIQFHDSSCCSEFILNDATWMQKWYEDIGSPLWTSQIPKVFPKFPIPANGEVQSTQWYDYVIPTGWKNPYGGRYLQQNRVFLFDVVWWYWLHLLAEHHKFEYIAVYFGDDLVAVITVSYHNKDLPMCITNFSELSIVAVQWHGVI